MTHLSAWRPARKFPDTYPGDRPEGAYLLLDDAVHPLHFRDPRAFDTAYISDGDGKDTSVDAMLADRGLAPLEQRYPVVAYGGNRNPATLDIKFRNYGYDPGGRGTVVPVLKGTLSACDVVAGGISGQGYCYGDLLVDSEWSRETTVEAWLTLLDQDQLRVINDSEGVHLPEGDYTLGRIPGYTIEGWNRTIRPLGYTGTAEIFVSPALDSPMAFSTVHATGRQIFAAEPLAMFDHLLQLYDLAPAVAELIDHPVDSHLSLALSRYMNQHWWRAFEDGVTDNGYSELIHLLSTAFHQDSVAFSTSHYLEQRGMLLTPENAYAPGDDLTLAAIAAD